MNRNILIVVALQVLFLCGMVAAKQYTLNTGEQILLETEPVDPRSLFRGDYVYLNYAIGELDLETLAGEDEFKRHEWFYLTLEQDDIYFRPVAIHREKPAAKAGQVVLRGRVDYVMTERWDSENRKSVPQLKLRAHYGIENYFVPEGTGRELELRWSEADEKRVDVRVAVDRFGKSGIKAVLVNGEEKYVETLF